MEEYKLTNDYIFKKIFGTEGNENILKELLISILNIPIKEIELLHDVHLERETEESKEGILDIKATLNNNITVNIEMQVKNEYNMIDRSLYYWSKLYNGSLKKKQNYKETNKTIAINILDYNIFEYGPYHERCMIKREYNNEILTNDLEIHFIQIPKCKKEKIKTTLDFWIRFIGNIKDKEVEEMKKEVSKETWNAVAEVQEQYWKIMSDPETRAIADLREKAIMDRKFLIAHAEKEGREKGIEQGEKNKSIEIAKKLKQKNIDIKEIIEITGLTKLEVERL